MAVNDPSERITLALKPKVVQEGTTRRIPNLGKSDLPPGLDPAVYTELLQATQTYDYLSRFGDPVEFWEAVRLARSHRGIAVSADGSAEPDAPTDNGLAEELQVIRRQLSPMVRDLRRYLQKVPDLPPKGEALEVALGFLLASSREHQAVAKWLAESDKHLGKAASKLRSLYDIAAPYLEALRPWSLDGPKAPVAVAAPGAAPAKPAAPAADAAVAPLAGEPLENFRRAGQMWKILLEAELPSAFWEILLLNTAERLPCQSRLEQIARARQEKKVTTYHEEVRNLHGKLLPLRASHGRWVDATSSWLRSLSGVPQDPTMFDMALGLLVVDAGGKDRARRWLTEPETSIREAIAHIGTLARQVKATIPLLK